MNATGTRTLLDEYDAGLAALAADLGKRIGVLSRMAPTDHTGEIAFDLVRALPGDATVADFLNACHDGELTRLGAPAGHLDTVRPYVVAMGQWATLQQLAEPMLRLHA
jgi:hypothetical protein